MENDIVLRGIEAPIDGRRFAVGDIHGCVETFDHLVGEVLQLTHEDQLFLLGDYIDRGPSSSGVIDYILDLQSEGYQVYPIRGNHEAMFLESYDDYCVENDKPQAMWNACQLYGCEDLLDEDNRPFSRYIDFMNHLPYCIELEHCYLVHAGLSKKRGGIFKNTDAMLWQRKIEIFSKDVNDKFVIHGHTPTDIKAMRLRIEKRYFDIVLDNGCVFYDSESKETDKISLGRLCALDLDSFELHEVTCIDNIP